MKHFAKFQKEYYHDNFPISQLANFHDVKKIDTNFPYNTFVANISQQGTFFQEYIEIELKIYFKMFEGLFEWQI